MDAPWTEKNSPLNSIACTRSRSMYRSRSASSTIASSSQLSQSRPSTSSTSSASRQRSDRVRGTRSSYLSASAPACGAPAGAATSTCTAPRPRLTWSSVWISLPTWNGSRYVTGTTGASPIRSVSGPSRAATPTASRLPTRAPGRSTGGAAESSRITSVAPALCAARASRTQCWAAKGSVGCRRQAAGWRPAAVSSTATGNVSGRVIVSSGRRAHRSWQEHPHPGGRGVAATSTSQVSRSLGMARTR